MIEYLNNIDSQVFLFLNGLHLDEFDHAVKMFSGRFIWIPMYSTILFILLRTCTIRQVALYIAALAMAILLTDQTCATFIRPYVERLRPANLENPLSALTHIVDGYRGGRYGFPSCHAANSFALAVFLACMIRRRRFVIFIFGWAVLNSYSRIYLGVHYPGDLLVGGCIGSLFGWLTFVVASRFDNTPNTLYRQRQNEEVARIPAGLTFNGYAVRINTRPILVTDVMILTFGLTLFFIITSSVISLL